MLEHHFFHFPRSGDHHKGALHAWYSVDFLLAVVLGAAAVGASLRVAFRGGSTNDGRMLNSIETYEPVDHILGHRKVDECPAEELVNVTADGREQMRRCGFGDQA